MVLDDKDRGFLENIIDNVISQIPSTVDMARTISKVRQFQIENPNDFVLGMAWGEIFKTFSGYYAQIHSRVMTDEESNKVADIIENRTKEIKEAIFKCG